MTLHITPDSSPRTVTLQPGARVLIKAGSEDVIVEAPTATGSSAMTPDLLNALAALCDAIANGWTVRDDRNQTDGYKIPWPAEAAMDKAGADVAALLGCGVPWDEVATALRARAATLTPGLPEGWTEIRPVARPDGSSRYAARGPLGDVVVDRLKSGDIDWDADGYAPPAVYAYLLARAGVVS